MTVKPIHTVVRSVDPRQTAKFYSKVYGPPVPKPFVLAASALRGLGARSC